jgi:hypothetical protein
MKNQQKTKKLIPSWQGFLIIAITIFLFFGGAFVYENFIDKSVEIMNSQP